MNKLYTCYETGIEGTYNTQQLQELFNTQIDESQKKQGTTFDTWLSEMLKMQILIEVNNLSEIDFNEEYIANTNIPIWVDDDSASYDIMKGEKFTIDASGWGEDYYTINNSNLGDWFTISEEDLKMLLGLIN